MYLSVCCVLFCLTILYICQYVHVSISLFIYLSVCPSIPTCLSISVFLSIHTTILLSICISVSTSFCRSVSPSIPPSFFLSIFVWFYVPNLLYFHTSILLSIYCPSLHLFIYLSFCPFISLSSIRLYIRLRACLTAYLTSFQPSCMPAHWPARPTVRLSAHTPDCQPASVFVSVPTDRLLNIEPFLTMSFLDSKNVA